MTKLYFYWLTFQQNSKNNNLVIGIYLKKHIYKQSSPSKLIFASRFALLIYFFLFFDNRESTVIVNSHPQIGLEY